MSHRQTSGFTLLELVVVLAILAVLTTLAVREVGFVEEQRRFETAQDSLQSIRDAILGAPADRAADGSRTIAGFVADMGRLPSALTDLWVNPDPSATFGIRPAAADSLVLVPGGWRGPYVRLPIGATGLLDGWGNPYTFATNTTDPRLAIGHLGADGLAGGTGYAEDRSISISNHQFQCSLTGYVDVHRWATGSVSGSVMVLAFGPHPGDPGQVLVAGDTRILASSNSTAQTPFVISGLTIGPRMVRAYFTADGVVTNRSPVKSVLLNAGPNLLNLVIECP
jgi:prepilin-type N-terminal cleavage/methylation domain-containing protein